MPAAFVRLFLVRHAEALANPDLRYLGSRDDPLTARGQWQALQLAQALVHKYAQSIEFIMFFDLTQKDVTY